MRATESTACERNACQHLTIVSVIGIVFEDARLFYCFLSCVFEKVLLNN